MRKGLRKHLSRNSVLKDYFLLFAALLTTIVLLSAWYTYSVYSARNNLQKESVTAQSNVIAKELASSFDYITNLMHFFGSQILEDPNNLKAIAKILQGNLVTNNGIRERYSWQMFDWSKPDKKIIVSTSFGILKKPIDVTYRYYAKMADIEPWVLHLDAPDIGVTSGKYVIPAGMGITDSNGNFIGMLSMGFDVAKLTKNIENSISNYKDKISFIIFDSNYKITLTSSDIKLTNEDRDYFSNKLATIINKRDQSGTLQQPIEYNEIAYSHFVKTNGYPYTILIGYNKATSAGNITDIMLPTVLGSYLIFGFIALLLLYYFHRLTINPIVNLSEAADKIAKGEETGRIRGGKTYEINNLALQIIKLKKSLLSEKNAKNEQKKLIRLMRESDDEKELFLRELYHALKMPLKLVKLVTDMMKAQQLGSDLNAYDKYFDLLSGACTQIESYTTDNLKYSEVSIKNIIKRSVVLHRKQAADDKINIEIHIANEVPNIIADEFRLKQMIIGILGHSIMCTQHEGLVKISAYVENHDTNNELVIKVEDNGLGISEQERIADWERAFGLEDNLYQNSRNPDLTYLSFPAIRHLAALHKGKFKLDAKDRIGSTFTITLPYLDKKDLEALPNVTTGGKKTKKSKKTNVILFPKSGR